MTRTSQQAKPFEIRDPVHGFISLDETERRVLDSLPMQRLKHIHQLALTYQVYPGATHKRFEHSLGVMELAGRAFDVLMGTESDEARGLLPKLGQDERDYWRKAVRLAALCHDLGHLPFSHASEGLLPQGWTHEQISRQLILGDDIGSIWETVRPPIKGIDIAKLALGPREYRRGTSLDDPGHLTDWESLLSQIITNDTFGVDRMDYLLRDSHHLGVAYGKFDHERLIRMLRVLPARGEPGPFNIGIEEGGMHSAEALLNARYFMFMQVYYHRARVAYDYHLESFLAASMKESGFATDLDQHQRMTDNEVTSALARSANDVGAPGHSHARAIMRRQHMRLLFVAKDDLTGARSQAINHLESLCVEKYGDDVHLVAKPVKFTASHAMVRRRDGSLVAFDDFSDMAPARLNSTLRFVLISPGLVDKARAWVDEVACRLGLRDNDSDEVNACMTT